MAEYKLFDKSYLPSAFGMANVTGAKCWHNSLIQGLLSCTSFCCAICDITKDNGNNTDDDQFVKLWKPLIEAKSSAEISHWSYQIFLATSKNLISGQQCADEGFGATIEKLPAEIQDLFTIEYKCGAKCPMCGHIMNFQRDPPNRLYLKEAAGTYSSAAWSQLIRSPEFIVSFVCEKCKVMQQDVRGMKYLARCSEIITIVFTKYFEKRAIVYPEYFEFKNKKRPTIAYRLVSAIMHFGSLGGGHYCGRFLRKSSGKSALDGSGNLSLNNISNDEINKLALNKSSNNADGTWVTLNDSSVSLADSQPTANDEILFYEMCEVRAPSVNY